MTDEVDKLKNIFNNFKILVAKVNDDNKNKKKKSWWNERITRNV